jgi:hypothetical protein
MSDKIRVFDHIANFSEGTSFEELYEGLAHIHNLANMHDQSDHWTDITVEFLNSEWDGNGLVITGYRLETDKEYAARQREVKKAAEVARKNKERTKAAKEERDRKEYERLKKKFEKRDNDVVIDIIETVTKHEHAWVNFGGVYHLGNPEQWQECATCKEKRKL